MKVKYDKEADAKYITLKKGKVFRTERINDWLSFDYSKKNEILGIEILNASQRQFGVSTIGGELLEFFDLKSVFFEDKKIEMVNSAEVNIPRERFGGRLSLEPNTL